MTAPRETSNGGDSPEAILIHWANQQDQWVRRIVSAAISIRRALPEQAVATIYEAFLREKALAGGHADPPVTLSAGSSAAALIEPLELVRMQDLTDVNALHASQCIDFNPSLTILFGENAAGKTGYVRVLKRVAGARSAEPVLPNLTTRSAARPQAQLTYRLGGIEHELLWKDDAGVPPLTRLDVFDSRASALHVDSDLNYVYTPGELSRFPEVQQAIEGVRLSLESAISQRAASNAFRTLFERDTRVYTIIDSLGASTDTAELQRLATVAPEEEVERNNLISEIDALRSSNPAIRLASVESTLERIQRLVEVLASLYRLDLEPYNSSVKAANDARRRYDEAAQNGSISRDGPALSSEPGRQFVEAGELYIQSIGRGDSYPADDDGCLYCQQELSDASLVLIRSYRAYCTDHIASDLAAANERLQALSASIKSRVDPNALNDLIEQLKVSEVLSVEEKATLDNALLEMRELDNSIQARREAATDRSYATRLLDEALPKRISELTKLASDLRQSGQNRAEAIREREARLKELNARILLSKNLPQITEYIERTKWADRANIQLRRFPTILRSLTEAAKVASEDLLNRDFERRFVDESTALGAPTVKLEFPGRQGKVTRRKAFAEDHRLSETLSEGEQKVIALADFLAEVSLKPQSPVIFDDPINSLDYKRLSVVASRIALLAESRQVVVFTHNIWFTTELLGRFEKAVTRCSYYNISRDGQAIGIVTKAGHPRDDSFSTLRGQINGLIGSATKATGDVREALIEKAYERLRTACEVFVERDLLQGVTQRYEANVRMTMLEKIKPEALEDAIKAVMPIFNDSCRYIGSHSQPLETLNVRPDLETLKADWAKLQDARKAYEAA